VATCFAFCGLRTVRSHCVIPWPMLLRSVCHSPTMTCVQIANRVITRDLEALIAKAVSTDKADYAVITGVQVHSWPNPETGHPAIEYVMPSTGYVVVNNTKSELNLSSLPPMTPRQMAILAAGGNGSGEAVTYLKGSTVQAVPMTDPAVAKASPLLLGARRDSGQVSHEVPAWAAQFSKTCC
jgi:hypothetical protein